MKNTYESREQDTLKPLSLNCRWRNGKTTETQDLLLAIASRIINGINNDDAAHGQQNGIINVVYVTVHVPANQHTQ
jgi:hypothetical protein